MPKLSQSGFIPLVILAIFAAFIIGGTVIVKTQIIDKPLPEITTLVRSSPSPSSSAKPSTTTKGTSKASPSPTAKSTPTSTPSNQAATQNSQQTQITTSATPTPSASASPTPTQAATASLTNFEPKQSYAGETISIYGSNLGSSSGTVTFEGKNNGIATGNFNAEIITWESYRIKVKVPTGSYNTARISVKTSDDQTVTLTDDAFNNFTFTRQGV